MNFRPATPLTRSQAVFESLRTAIFSGGLQPGQSLKELQLASEFQVSQSTIREALLRLEKTGLITREAHRCTKVTEFTHIEIRDRLVVRLHLEELACTLAMKHLAEPYIQQLHDKAALINQAVEENSYADLVQADQDFHRTIWRLSGNDVLGQTFDQIALPLYAFLGMQHSRHQSNLRTTVIPHDQIVQALVEKDCQRIKQILQSEKEGVYRPYFFEEDSA